MTTDPYTPDRGTVRYRYVDGDYSGFAWKGKWVWTAKTRYGKNASPGSGRLSDELGSTTD